MLQLCELSLRERPPAFRRAGNIAEAKKQASDFSQCKTELTSKLNYCQAVKHPWIVTSRSEEHTSELQSRFDLVCRLLLEKKNSPQAIRSRCRISTRTS